MILVSFVMTFFSSDTIGQGKIIKPIKYSYTAFNGDKYSSLLYEGQYTNLIFTDTLIHDDTTCTKMSIMLDSVWNYYYMMTDVLPNTSTSYNKKGNIAFVSNTCGAGCAFIGTGSLEVGDASWVNIYNNIKYLNNGAVLKVAFYELGRNFYNGKIDENLSVYPFWIPEPYANMGYLNAIDHLGLYMKNEYENEIGYKYDLVERANEFILDTNVKSISDVYSKNLYPNAYGIPEFRPFFNSGLLMKLCFEFGENFIFNFYKELYKLPKTNGIIAEAFTNLCIASSKAVKLNLKQFFLKGYKLPLNEKRIDAELSTLPFPPISIIASDKKVNRFYSSNNSYFRIKAINYRTGNDIEYKLYIGNVNDSSKLALVSTNGIFEMPSKKFDYPFWIKISDGINTIATSQMYHAYRGNLLSDTSFEQQPNVYPMNASSSLEFYGQPYNALLSASRDSIIANNGKFSLRFNHSFFKDCGKLTNSNFPTVDYTQSFIEPFKGKFKVSAKFLFKQSYKSCPGIVYGGVVIFGIRNRTFISLPGNTNSIVASDKFQEITGYFDTKDDQDTHPKSSFFTIISGGIQGDSYVDDIAIRAVLEPEKIDIISVNQDSSNFFETCKTPNLKLSILVDSAQDISEYQLTISNDSLFKNNIQIFKSHKPSFILDNLNTGISYIQVQGINEFGKSISSNYKKVNIKPTPAAPLLSRDSSNSLIANVQGITWYKDGVKMADTATKIKPNSNGNYTATTTQNGCISLSSLSYFYITTYTSYLSTDRYFKVSPNPTQGEILINFNLGNTKDVFIEVLDMSGRILIRNTKIYNGIKLKLEKLPKGSLMIHAKDKNGTLLANEKLISI